MWNNQDPLSVSSHDDFQFLDMGSMGINSLGEGLQFDFQDFTNQQSQGGQLMHQGGSMGGQDTTMQEHLPSMTTTSSHPTIPGTAMSVHAPSNDSISDLDAQIQYLQHQRNQQQQQRQIQEQQQNYYVQNQMIPPTPNSIEMHSGSYRHYPSHSNPQQQQAIYERYQLQLKDSEVSPSYVALHFARLIWFHRCLLLLLYHLL